MRNYLNKNIIKGFTLAEVLITLGIIGVVAAMTIPTLITEYKKSVVETRLEKFYSTINQAIKLSEIDNGDKKSWDTMGASSSDVLTWYNKYLAPYIVDAKLDSTTLTDKLIVYLNDGSALILNAQGWRFFPEAKDSVSYITSADLSKIGTKMFNFYFLPNNTTTNYQYHYDKGVEPFKYRWDGTANMLKTDAAYGCKQTVTNSRAYCTALIQINSWKIPDDYLLNF